MTVELMNNKTVMITLTREDMEDMFLSYESMRRESEFTRGTILRIIKRAERATNLDFTRQNIFVEILPHINGGCVLFIHITKSRKTKKYKNETNSPLIFKLSDIRQLENACMRLFRQVNHLILKSRIYSRNEIYYLVVYTYFKLDHKIIAVAGEFGLLDGRGELRHSQIKEISEIVITDNAVQKIAEIG